MPTAAKLFAAFALAVVAFFTAEIIKPHMEDGTQFGAFVPISALIGLVCGWRILGPEAGRGWYSSANSGLKSAVILLALALFLFSTYEMLVLAFRRTYDGPMEAVVDIVSIGVDYLSAIFAPDVILALFGGAILAGLLSEWAARRWR
jgi:hypothetical protein